MKNYTLKIFAILLFFWIMSISIFLLMQIGIKQEYSVSPCVDGDGDINLAGIMCNKLETSFFGVPDNSQDIIVMLVFIFGISLLGLVVSFIGFIYIFLTEKSHEDSFDE